MILLPNWGFSFGHNLLASCIPICVALFTSIPPSWCMSLSKENSSKYPGAADEARTAAQTGWLQDPLKLEWIR